MYTCEYVYVHTYTHIHIYICMHIYMYLYTCIYPGMFTYTRRRTQLADHPIYTHVCLRIYTYIYLYVYIPECEPIRGGGLSFQIILHIHMYVYEYTHIYTYTYTFQNVNLYEEDSACRSSSSLVSPSALKSIASSFFKGSPLPTILRNFNAPYITAK